MNRIALPHGRTLSAAVAAIAIFNTLSALTLPLVERRPRSAAIALWLLLLAAHAALYWLGDTLRSRFGLRAYAAAQAVLLACIVASGMPTPVGLGLLMAATAELVLLARGRWGAFPITAGAIVIYVAAALGTTGLYGAATAGLLLAITGTLAHALAALVRRDAVAPEAGTQPRPPESITRTAALSPREAEVLAELVQGARNSEIAARLGITERTVKAHLAHIYQKLGVESRAAAISAVLGRRLS